MTNYTFLPEDYVAKRTERRTNLICVSLFAIVMVAVFGAFLVTNQAWSQIKREQDHINLQYFEAGQQIQELTELERQRDEMLHKAELAAALVERVPRSILLAELINRMPEQLGLLAFVIESRQVQQTREPKAKVRTSGGGGRARPDRRPQTKEEADDSLKRIEPPRLDVKLTMTGVAPSDREVTSYLSELNNYALLQNVTLLYIEQKEFEGRRVREFRVSMSLAQGADVRQIDPLQVPRDGLRNPMQNNRIIMQPSDDEQASVPADKAEGE